MWTVNSIFLTAIGVLLVYVHENKQHTPAASIVGPCLIQFLLYYISGFRKMRNNLHSKLRNDALRATLTNPYGAKGVSQWSVYCFGMLVITVFFVDRVRANLKGPTVIYEGLVLVLAFFIWKLWLRGRSPR